MESEHQINSFQELVDCMNELHDYPFTLSEATFDNSQKVWKGIFLRPMLESEDRVVHKGSFIYGKTECPVAKATLTISSVSNIEVIDDQGIDRYSFNGVQSTDKGFRLEFNEAMMIEFEVETIMATYSESELSDKTAVFKNLLIIESGPEILQNL